MRSGIDFLAMRMPSSPDSALEDFERFFLEEAAEGVVDVLFVVDDEDGLADVARDGGSLRCGGCGRRGGFAGGGGHGKNLDGITGGSGINGILDRINKIYRIREGKEGRGKFWMGLI